MPRAFLVKKRRERETLGEDDVLIKHAPILGTVPHALVVNPELPYTLSVTEPGLFDGDASPVHSECSTIERSQSEDSLDPRVARDPSVVTGVKKEDTNMPLDLSNHKDKECIPLRNLSSSPRSAFHPVKRVFVRQNTDEVGRSPNLQRPRPLSEFFDFPRYVTSHPRNMITGHELSYVSPKKGFCNQNLPVMWKDSRGQVSDNYFPHPFYTHYGMPLPYVMNKPSTNKRLSFLETDRDLYKSSITIPTVDGPSVSDKPSVSADPAHIENRLLSSPEHFNRFDNSIAQPELMGEQLHKEFLKQHLVSVRGAMCLGKLGQRQARAPVAGLEYIQNGSDTKLRDIIESECKEIEEEEGERLVKTEPQDSPQETEQTTIEDTLTSTQADNLADNKPQQLKKYRCDVCGKGFSRSNTLVTHKRIHTGDKPFKCELCGRAFRQPGNLTRHRLTHTTVKPYVCSQCGKAFNRASNLHTHMRTHTNYKPFVCQYCGKGFHQKIDMKIHSYTHTGEKPHKCKKCGRGFKQLTHLTYHMRTHSDVKMYTCAYCGKGFNQKGNLQAHIYGHTGERPYKCEVCGKGFTLASTLNTHRRTHADRKPFICQYCGKDFYQKNALKSHVIASHPFTGPECIL